MQAQAARTVRSLATGSQHNKKAIIAADAVPAILALLGAEQSAVQLTAMKTFKRLDPREDGDGVIAAGALPLLIVLLRSEIWTQQVLAAGALTHLANGSQKTRDDIFAVGIVPLLVTLLRSNKPAVQQVVGRRFDTPCTCLSA